MPLPAYLLAVPATNPTDVLWRQLNNLGLKFTMVRNGATITISGLDPTDGQFSVATRAIRLITLHADANGLSVDAIVTPGEANMISRYEAAGFTVHVGLADDADEDAHALLRRPARS